MGAQIPVGQTPTSGGRFLRAEREQLGMLANDFNSLAKLHFSFLERDFGFKRHDLGQTSFNYESGDVFVLVGYDSQRSHELTLQIGQRGNPQRCFNFGEVLRSVNAPSDVASAYQASSKEALEMGVRHIAESLQKYAGPLLHHDLSAFARLIELREREGREYAHSRDLRLARANADAAWQRKDYRAVVNALGPYRAALTATEVGKLEFAEKQCSL